MSTHKHFDKICCVIVALTLIVAVLFVNGDKLGIKTAPTVMGYEQTLFDTSRVHTIDIVMDNWNEFIANCKSEEYYSCAVVIDNESYKNVAIRGKGNTSLSSVKNDRYSYKIEFDHYDSKNTYHGLDKLCLNNIIQDNTYMKDYLTYQMMNEMGVAAPLCSYVYITVNGEEWGLYLAVEGVEESFLQRNYGKDYGELYKPDSLNMGGGRGNGEKFNADEFFQDFEMPDFNFNEGNTEPETKAEQTTEEPVTIKPEQTTQPVTDNPPEMPEGITLPDGVTPPEGFDGNFPEGMTPPEGFDGIFPEGMTPPEGFDGNFPEGMTPPEGFNGNFPEDMTPPEGFDGNFPEGMTPPEGFNGNFPEGMTPPEGFGGMMPWASGMSMTGTDTVTASFVDAKMPDFGGQMPEGFTMPSGGDFKLPENFEDMFGGGGFGGFGGMGSSDVKLQYIDDNIDSYSTIFGNAKTDITDADKTRLIQALKKLSNGEELDSTVDIEAVIRYFVVHNFVVNSDSYTGSMIHNYYLYEKDGQMQMIPWDYNLAFGSFMAMGSATGSVNDPIDTPLSVNGSGDRPMIDWIFSSEEYTELYHKYFNEFIEKYFSSGYFENLIDSTAALISPYVEKDPTKFCTYEEFWTGVATLREFCLLRAESVKGQLNGTIGSTSATQVSGTLIDASSLDVSTMGTMGGKGGGMNFPGGDMQKPSGDSASDRPSTQPDSSENSGSSRPQMPGGFGGNMPPGFSDGMPDMSGGNMERPEGGSRLNSEQSPSQTQSVISTSFIIMIGVSAAVLVLGLVFALLYKRRK